MSELTYVDEFWKEPDRAIIAGVRSFSDGRECALSESTKRLDGLGWGEVKTVLAGELEAMMKRAGITAIPQSGWTARTKR